MSAPGRTERPERLLFAAGTATYRNGALFSGGLSDLNSVPQALQTIVAALAGLGYELEQRDHPFLLNPMARELEDEMGRVAGAAPLVVIYYTGHGLHPEDDVFYLLTSDSAENDLIHTAVEARRIARLLRRSDKGPTSLAQSQVLVILDCCYAGAAGTDTLRDSLAGVSNPNLWVVASAGSLEWAQQGRFAQVLGTALHESVGVGDFQEFIDPWTLITQINRALKSINADQRATLFPPQGQIRDAPPPFFPNPKYISEAARLTVESQQWMSRLRAAPDKRTATEGFYVTGATGRVRAVEDIAGWIRSYKGSGLAVVTGSPGSGKSTILALPAILADPEHDSAILGAQPEASLLVRSAELFADMPVLGIYARGLNEYTVSKALARRLGRPEPKSPKDLLRDLTKSPGNTARIVIIDAVDEADDPQGLVESLILKLTQVPGMKVLIGTRRHLLTKLHEPDLVVDLDAERYRDPQALTQYARLLLLAVHEPVVPTPYRDAPKKITTAVAVAIANRATATPSVKGQAESFLLCRLLAHAVRARDFVPDVTVPGWADELSPEVGAAFEEDLARLGGQEDTARALLKALAWARGPGMPWEGIWESVAGALSGDAKNVHRKLDSGDVQELLQNAGGYIIEDIGPGQRSVFRLFHDLLAVHLRGEPVAGLDDTHLANHGGWHQHRQEIEAVITKALLGTVPRTPDDHLDWEQAHPYVRTYLAQHAYDAGIGSFSPLVADPDYLAVADPDLLTPLLTPFEPELPLAARAYRRARTLLGRDANDNAAYIQEAFVAEAGRPPAGQGIRPTYRTLMANVDRDDSVLTLAGHNDYVESVAFGTTPDGRILLASGSRDHTVRVWDPLTGEAVGGPLTGHTHSVDSVAFGTAPDGHVLLASGSQDQTVRLWDPLAGKPIGQPLRGHESGVESIAFGTGPDGAFLLASTDGCNQVFLWDPTTGNPAVETLTAGDSWNWATLGTGPSERLLMVFTDSDNTAWLWDPVRNQQVGEQVTGIHHDVGRGAFSTTPDGRLLLATAGLNERTIELWDLSAGSAAGDPVTDHPSSVYSVAIRASANGQLLLAAGCHHEVRLWDLSMDARNSDTFAGHSGAVWSVALVTAQDERLLVASGADDGTVRVWDRKSKPHNQPTPQVASGRVTSVAFGPTADGRLLLAAAADRITLWDISSGSAVLGPEISYANSIAFGSSADGRMLLASGSPNGVIFWDPVTGAQDGAPLLGHPGSVMSVACGTLPDGRLLVASVADDFNLCRWDANMRAPLGEPISLPGFIWSIAFGKNPKGPLLLAAAVGDDTVRLWNAATGEPAGKPLRVKLGQGQGSVAFGTLPDGRPVLATGGRDGLIHVWNPLTRARIGKLVGHVGDVQSLAFGYGPAGRLLLSSAAEDRTVRLWDPLTGASLRTLRRRAMVNAVALQGSMLAVGDDEGTALLDVTQTGVWTA